MSDFPYRPIDREEWTVCKRVMRNGNLLIVRWTKTIRQKRDLNKVEFSHKKFREELFKAVDERKLGQRIYVRGTCIPKADVDSILAVRGIQNKIFMGYTRLLSRRAGYWAAMATTGYPTFSDFQDEGCLALIEAIYGWCKKGTQFKTYAQWTIDNALLDAFNAANPLSTWTVKDRKLRYQLEQTEKGMNKPHNMPEAIQEMDDLLPKDLIHLQRTFVSLTFESNVSGDRFGSNSGEDFNDYTAMAKPVLPTVADEGVVRCVRELLNGLVEGSFEWKVIQSAMIHGTEPGWQVELSAAEGKSRSAVGAVLRRLRDKLGLLYTRHMGGAKPLRIAASGEDRSIKRKKRRRLKTKVA